jgi:predicted enzyme related to lactoylglutathione lyase
MVAHFEIVGADGTKLQNFYRELFDWEVNADNPMNYGLVDPSSAGVGGGIGGSPDGSSHVTVYVAVDDPQAYLDRIEQMGGKTIMPVTEIPGMVTFAQFADPEGNMVGLIKDAP